MRKGLVAKETIEQSDCFVFNNGTITTFNDEIAAACSTNLYIEGAVKAQPLMDLLRKAKDDKLKVQTKKGELRISGNNFRTGIKLEHDILLPTDKIPKPSKFIKVPENFSQLAKLACLTASKAFNQRKLSNVHLEGNRIESCDNDRITICYMEKSFEHDILIPATNLLEIVKESIKAISVDKNWVHFKTNENVVLSTALDDNEYLDLKSCLPEGDGHVIEFPTQIGEIIGRANIFSKKEEEGEKIANISIKDGVLQISTFNETGWYVEKDSSIDMEDDLKFSINTDFLLDVIKMTNQVSIVHDNLMFEDDHAVHLIKLEED